MDFFDHTTNIIAVLHSTSEAKKTFAGFKEPPIELTHTLDEMMKLRKLLIELAYHIEVADHAQTWYATVRSLFWNYGPLHHYKQALDELNLKQSLGQSWFTSHESREWPSVEKRTATILSRLTVVKPLIEAAVLLDSSLSQAILRESHRQCKHVLEWISPIDFSAQHNKVISRQKETENWFLCRQEFVDWMKGLEKTLFCHGLQATDLTRTAASVVHLLLALSRKSGFGVAYQHCGHKTNKDKEVQELLAGILKQLLQSGPMIPEVVNSLYDKYIYYDARSDVSLQDIFVAINFIVAFSSEIYIVIDSPHSGLDDIFRELFATLMEIQARGNVRILVTGGPHLRNELGSALQLEVPTSKAEMEQFVTDQMGQLPQVVQSDLALQVMVREKVLEAAQGLLPLARLHLNSLHDKRTKESLQVALENLPRGQGAYGAAMQRIESQSQKDCSLAKRVLRWLMHSKRLLTCEELCEALVVKVGDTALNRNDILKVKDVITVCMGLVTLDWTEGKFCLAHPSVREYLEQVRDPWMAIAQEDISTTCLTYLSFKAFKIDMNSFDLQTLEEGRGKHHFASYAAIYWVHHVLTVQEQVSKLAESFLHDEHLISSPAHPAELSFGRVPKSDFPSRGGNGLHVIARYGLRRILSSLIRQPGKINAKLINSPNYYGDTPLSLAARYGHEQIVQILVNRQGTNVDRKDKTDRTAFDYAVENGHDAVVRLLVDRKDVKADRIGGADKPGQFTWKPTWRPILLAAKHGHTAVVKILADRQDVKTDGKNDRFRTALWYAAEAGHTAVVALLISRDDVDINAQDGSGETPISAAAKNGHADVVKLLLSRRDVSLDGRVGLRDGRSLSPLFLAIGEGHIAVVRTMLDRNEILAKTKDNENKKPLLETALASDHLDILKLLLEKLTV